jgi:hypothetical protein
MSSLVPLGGVKVATGCLTPDGVTGRSDQGTYVSACLCVLVTVSSLGYNS